MILSRPRKNVFIIAKLTLLYKIIHTFMSIRKLIVLLEVE
jgi:hypothetical protein